MAQTFEEYKKEIQDKLPKGYILDEDKMDKLKEAFDKGEKINEQDFAKPEKDSQKHEENNKDQKDAAIITPAANPNIPSIIFLLTFLKKNTKAAPNNVIPQVKQVAINAWIMGFKLLKKSIIYTPYLYLSYVF